MSSLTKTLLAAKALLNEQENWCQGALHKGLNTHCAYGAVHVVVAHDRSHDLDRQQYRDAIRALDRAAMELFQIPEDLSPARIAGHTHWHGPTKPATYVNDIIGFEAVHKMFDRAIMNSMVKETADAD